MLKFLNKRSSLLLILWVITLSILYSFLSVLRHNHFQSGAFDLGLYDQSIWQYANFLSPYNTIKQRFILGDHLALTLPLVSPLFYFWDNVRILLIFQAFWISFSTFAIHKLCKLRGLSNLTSLILSIIFSLFYGIQYAVFFDFHPVVMGVGFLAWLIYFLEAGRKKLFILTLVLTLLTQENMGIALASLGLIYIFKEKFRKASIFFIFFGLLISVVSAKIVSLFSSVGFQYTPQISLTPIKIFSSFFDSEEKRLVWLYSLSWFSFLPLLSPGAMMAIVLDLSQYFVANSNFTWMVGPYLHHRAILAIFLFLGVLDVFELLKKKKINLEKLSILLLLAALFLQFFFHFPLNKLSKKGYWKNESWISDNNSLFKLIPKNASIAAAQNLVPHLSHRKEIYLVYPRQRDSGWWLDFDGKPQFLVVDLRPNQWVTQLLETNENFSQAVTNMEKSRKIKLIKQINDAKLFQIIY
ncbi:DUF2079 domain-containing protein [Candidatus Microgenomates bacterium]|nr:MAG: DUF2079 domain-containing protein [Candidatus Microgenomates bacterium]